MAVLLHAGGNVPDRGWDRWCAIACSPGNLAPAAQLDGLGERLESAFDAAAADWYVLAKDLGQAADAALAHAPACAANISDLGQMLAWRRVVAELARAPETVLVLCADPWLFRDLAALPGVSATSPPPPLWPVVLKLALRGWLSRARVAWRCARAALSRHGTAKGGSCLLVYGHPRSSADGTDAYFGGLMTELPGLTRVLHVDCPTDRAHALGGVSLHGFGSPWRALGLVFAKWRPRSGDWLVRRAAALEGATGTPAMIAWQIHCQSRWLAAAGPKVVAWPWENHSWERHFVRTARALGVATIGYQHATVGWREWNYGPAGNADGIDSLPDRILCVGDSDRSRLVRYGVPAGRLFIGGALRFGDAAMPHHDSAAPIFVALPFDGAVSAEIVGALRPLGAAGRQFLVKPHPMTPFAFPDSAGLSCTAIPLGDLPAVSAVIYCMTTVGLEALLAGLPVLRFRPAGKVALDIVPEGFAVPSAGAPDLSAMLDDLAPVAAPLRSHVFAPPDLDLWRSALA